MSRLRSRFGLIVPALAGMVLLVAACEDDNGIIDDTFTDDTAAVTPTPTPAPDPLDDDADDAEPVETPEPADPEPTHEARFDLEEIDGSGVTGEVHVATFNGSSEVTVDLEGLDPNQEYTFQIRSGPCGEEDATLAFPLGAIEVEEDGTATASEELEVGFGLISGNHVSIELAPEDEEATQGDVVACADIEENDTDDGLFDDEENGEDDDAD